MRIIHSWLEEFLSKNLTVRQVSEAMEAAGIEVDAVSHSESLDSRIVAAKVKRLTPLRGSDRLQLAEVDGGSRILKVVCGAPNVREGQLVALAQTGAKLPDGTVIEPRSIRGQKSEGMLCSPRELGLGEDHSGLLELEASSKIGSAINRSYGKGETIFDVSVAANRPDLRSLVGVAREVAAHTSAALKLPRTPKLPSSSRSMFDNKISNLVPRYALAKLELPAQLPASPIWLQRRLQLAGLRPVHLVVDITNYVMLVTGQPLHAFDADKISGRVTVRRARDKEALKTIDGNKRLLDPADIVIADNRGAIALAGIMGGANTEIDAATTKILLESANFDGVSIRRSAIRQGLVSEASLRFQHQIPLSFVADGVARALSLLTKLAAAKLVQFEDERPKSKQSPRLKVDIKRMSQILGVSVKPAAARAALNNLGFDVAGSAGQLGVKPPDWRPDVELAEDVYEEVIKIIGLEQVPVRLPLWQPGDVRADTYWPKIWELRQVLRGLGLSEVTTYPFVSQAQISNFSLETRAHLKLKNPMSEEQTHLRSTLAPSMVTAAANNSRRAEHFGLFEISRVFSPASKKALPTEAEYLGVVMQSQSQAYPELKHIIDELAAALKLKLHLTATMQAGFLHPTRQAEVTVAGEPLALIGELDPLLERRLKIRGHIGYLEIALGTLLRYWRPPTVQPVSRYQSIWRDVTLVLDQQIDWQQLAEVIETSGLVKFSYGGDYYGSELPAGKRALTIKLEILPQSPNMSDREANAITLKLTRLLERKFGAQLQG